MFADGVADCQRTFGKLPLDLPAGLECQQRMGESVISDRVARLYYFADDIRTLADVTPNQKECRVNIVVRQYVQQAKRVGIVRPIVVGERQLL